MIRQLTVQNYAIIEQVEMTFDAGLTILTGETGAGKSILLGALGLILGQRADTKVLYNPNEKCIVEGVFDVTAYDLRALFDSYELDYDPREVIIRREIAPGGKSRAFINDTPVQVQALKDITGALVDLHQQFDTLDLQSTPLQLLMLDALCAHKELHNRYRALYKAYVANKRKLAELVALQSQSAKELDYLQFQFNELEQAQLDAGDLVQLEAEGNRLHNAEDIAHNLNAAYHGLAESETAVLSLLRQVRLQVAAVSKYHNALPPLVDKLDTLYLELEEVAASCAQLAEESEFDPERMSIIQARLDQLYRLMKKHGATDIESLMAIKSETAHRLEQLGDLSGDIAALEQQIAQQHQELDAWAHQLTANRKGAATPFEEKVHERLRKLSMPHARLMINVEPLSELGPDGRDAVQFLFASNKGSRPMPIKDIASGGELSRLSLVTKSLVAASIPLPTLIFDEIDAGVSGDVALQMGRILQDLANHHQVVVITHSPQVASRPGKHYFIYKAEANNRTYTRVRALTTDERVRSIAVMLSQNPPTEAALANAKELVEQ